MNFEGTVIRIKCNRILLVASLLLTFSVPSLADKTEVPEHDIKVVILGSGLPSLNDLQFGTSILVEAGGQPFLFDCGRGCGIRLGQVYGNGQYHRVDTLFITHHHSDHTVGIPELYMNGWIQGRVKPFRVWGPVFTRTLMVNIREAWEGDIYLRAGPESSADKLSGLVQQVTEFTRDGVLLEENGVRITAFEVNHRISKPAFGFRLDYKGRSVVISGDTAPSENLVKHAHGADLLLHEVLPPDLVENVEQYIPDRELRERVLSIHTLAHQAADIFSRVKPRLAAYYHYNMRPETVKKTIAETRETYDGPVVMGQDLTTIYIGEEVKVVEYQGR